MHCTYRFQRQAAVQSVEADAGMTACSVAVICRLCLIRVLLRMRGVACSNGHERWVPAAPPWSGKVHKMADAAYVIVCMNVSLLTPFDTDSVRTR